MEGSAHAAHCAAVRLLDYSQARLVERDKERKKERKKGRKERIILKLV